MRVGEQYVHTGTSEVLVPVQYVQVTVVRSSPREKYYEEFISSTTSRIMFYE